MELAHASCGMLAHESTDCWAESWVTKNIITSKAEIVTAHLLCCSGSAHLFCCSGSATDDARVTKRYGQRSV
jgi:hypothetical protein